MLEIKKFFFVKILICCPLTVLCKSLELPLLSLYFATNELANSSPDFPNVLQSFFFFCPLTFSLLLASNHQATWQTTNFKLCNKVISKKNAVLWPWYKELLGKNLPWFIHRRSVIRNWLREKRISSAKLQMAIGLMEWCHQISNFWFKYNPAVSVHICMDTSVIHGDGPVMVWSILASGVGDLVRIGRIMNAET